MALSADEIIELREWAKNSEQTIDALLQEGIRDFMRRERADHAELERRGQGPFYTLEEVQQHLAEQRRQNRVQAAE